jgi:hypothetical protein
MQLVADSANNCAAHSLYATVTKVVQVYPSKMNH